MDGTRVASSEPTRRLVLSDVSHGAVVVAEPVAVDVVPPASDVGRGEV